MAEMNEKLNHTDELMSRISTDNNSTDTKLEAFSEEAQKLQCSVNELLDQVEFMKNADVRGASDSISRYFQQSEAAEIRLNASTSDPDSLLEQSASVRRETEDIMNQTKEEFHKKQDEHAKALDNLAGQLETLDLSELSEKTCGSPAGSEACADSPCGGLGCVDAEGNKKCGGEGCYGFTTLARNAWQKAKDFDQDIVSAMEEVNKLSKMFQRQR